MFFYLEIDGDSNFMQFHYRLIVHQNIMHFATVPIIKVSIVRYEICIARFGTSQR
jgi:hypothetical protein